MGTATPDYAALAAEAREIELRYQPDRRRAEEVVAREMEALGAEMRGGCWHHDGAPVTLRVLIRNDDIRRQVGDYVANRLEDIGFGVERMYRDAEEASRIWIGGDPAARQWHVYTGAWMSTVVTRDTATSFDFYYTPRGRAEPLWQAYDPAPAFDEVSERLSRGDYADLEERAAMMARGLDLSMRDSARVWLVDQIQVGPRAADLAVSVDLVGGARGSQLWPLTAHYGDAPGGSARFAMPSVMTEPWNPVAGTNWLFDQMVLRAIDDSAFLPDPFTGLYRPQRVGRAELTVQAGTPVTKTLDWLALEEADPADKWLDFTQPPIPAVALDGPMMVAEGDGARFKIEITSAGAPYPAEDIAAAEFLLFDGYGTLTARGAAEAQDDGLWQVALSADQVAALGRGANSLEVVVTSEHVAMPVFASFAFATVPEGTRTLQ